MRLENKTLNDKIKDYKLLFYALIVGVLAGVVGSVFRIVLTRIEFFRENLFKNVNISDVSTWIIPVLFVIVGITVALYFVRKFAPETAGSGVQEIEGALDRTRPMRWKKVLPIKFIASLFSLGSGLLLGREGPTIQIGANIGKMVKDLFSQSDDEENALVSAGAAAGLTSAFNPPFAGIIFVIEEMHEHFRFNFNSVAAIMIGAGAADFVLGAMIGSHPVIEMTIYKSPKLSVLWLFILFGSLFSLIGFLYNWLLIKSLDFFQVSLKMPIILSGVLAGILIAVVGITYPDMIGGGYNVIYNVLNNSFTLYFLLPLFLIRLLLSIFSYSLGVPGGIFAPLLTLGVIFGMLFEGLIQYYFPNLIVQPGMFAVAGMAAIFASTVRAPLTGLVLAVEMTSNFELIFPLIITTVTASVFTTMLGNKPIYTTLLNRTLAKVKNTV
jgi:CIC family chloride channel protein